MPTIDRYQEVYRGTLTELEDARSDDTLEKLYEKFNLRIPEDFRGHSLSTGDIVELNFDGEKTFNFVDSIGFRKLENFESAEIEDALGKMKKREQKIKVGFYHGALEDAYEKQANEQGFTLGDKAELFDKIAFSYNLLWIHGYLTDKQADSVCQKIQKALIKNLKPLEGDK